VTPESPYKGLNAFEDSELDALLFFGREREGEIVVANLIASRLTVLYGPSGVGKSSLLHAAVARSLRELPEEPLVVVFSSWSDDPNSALAEAVAEAARVPANGSAVAALERAQAERDVYLVLDQAEEYFLYHAEDGGPGSFAEALPAVLAAQLRVNVLVSLREDSLAKLDRFTGRIPSLFSNTLRLDRLDRNAGRAAIVRPAERYAELTGVGVSVEPALVERVLDEVGAGQIEPALGGLGAVDAGDSGARIEAPYLQLVMQRIWDEERAGGSNALRAETLDRLGGAQHIVEEHLEGAMAELATDQKDVAARLFNHLVTPSGTKIAHDVADLADFASAPVSDVQPVLSQLTDRRILRSLEEGGHVRYEIFHDVLAQPVLAWRGEYEAERELELQRAASDRRHRRLLAIIAAGAVLLAVMGAVTAYALTQRSEAREQARVAKANGLVVSADAELVRDPELSLLLALEAARDVSSERVERSLQRALVASRVRGVVDVGAPLLDAAARGDAVLAVTQEGDVVVTMTGTGEILDTISTGVAATDVSFATDGTPLVTGADGRVRIVREDGRVEVVPGVVDALAASISPDGSLVVVVEPGRARLVDPGDGGTLFTYRHPGARSAAISPDNRRVLTGGADDLVRVWSGQSGRRVHTLTEQTGNAVAVAFSPDGEWVASASSDGTARIWKSRDWGLTSSLTGHTNALTNVAFSADGEHVVTTGRDATARVSHTANGDELFVLAGHRGWVASAAFSGIAESPIVTSGADGSIRTWDAVFQPQLDTLARLGAPITSIAVDSEIHARTSAGREHVLALSDGSRLGVMPVPKRRPRRVEGPDGTAATMRGTIVVLRKDGRSLVLRHRDRVNSIAFSPSGQLLATGSRDRDARIWNVASGELVQAFPHNSAVRDAQFSPDGRWLVTAAPRASLWDAREGTNIVRLKGHEGTVTSAAFDPSGRTIVTGGEDGTIRSYRCQVCGGLDDLVALAERRLQATRRELTSADRERYLG
jgi:WD domain, G-beta repeat